MSPGLFCRLSLCEKAVLILAHRRKPCGLSTAGERPVCSRTFAGNITSSFIPAHRRKPCGLSGGGRETGVLAHIRWKHHILYSKSLLPSPSEARLSAELLGLSSISIRTGGESRSSNCPPRMQRTQAHKAAAPSATAIGSAMYITLMLDSPTWLPTDPTQASVRVLSGCWSASARQRSAA